jgi:DNA-binding transcriptional regulator/RsmH inhibitor MraZ
MRNKLIVLLSFLDSPSFESTFLTRRQNPVENRCIAAAIHTVGSIMTAITIDETGRLEIPLEIRQQLGLTAAQSLNLEVSNGCIILQPAGQAPLWF